MTGEVVSCPCPKRYANHPWPGKPRGTLWRCECGVVWRAYEYRWAVVGWRGRRYALKRHLRWLDDWRRREAMRAAFTPDDHAWLARHGGAMTTPENIDGSGT